MEIAIIINIYTGRTSKKPINIDLVKVVAKPTRKKIAKERPITVVNLFIKFFTLFLTRLKHLKNDYHRIFDQQPEYLKVNYFHLEVKEEKYRECLNKTKLY